LRLNGWRTPASRWERPRETGGFSLIELLIVLALLLIMIVLMHGSGSRSRQERDKAGCQKNLHQVYLALELFSNDHDGLFPVVTGAKSSEEPLALLVPKYTVATETFICPGGRDPGLPDGEPFTRRRISYAYYMGLRAVDAGEPLMSDRQVNTAPRNKGELLFSTTGQAPGNNHHKYGGNVLFVGGDVRMSRPKAEFDLKPTQAVVLLNPKP
jgi:prepilin-type N-terminal cleavage/methylation domain-containing protein